jgi:hypothetical protein
MVNIREKGHRHPYHHQTCAEAFRGPMQRPLGPHQDKKSGSSLTFLADMQWRAR